MDDPTLRRFHELSAEIGRAMAEPVHIRPPMESESVLIRATRACSWNACRHCGLYRESVAGLRPLQEVLDDIRLAHALHGTSAAAVFLGDADLLALPPAEARTIVVAVAKAFSQVGRISAYVIPHSACTWSEADLRSLARARLTRIYTGSDTGSERLQKLLDRPATPAQDTEGMRRLNTAGFTLWMKVALGLGGRTHSEEHIHETASMINAVRPAVVSIRTLAAGYADPLTAPIREGRLELVWADESRSPILSPEGTLDELRTLIRLVDCETEVICDHASNFVPHMQGILPFHRETMLETIDRAEEALRAQKNPLPIRLLM